MGQQDRLWTDTATQDCQGLWQCPRRCHHISRHVTASSREHRAKGSTSLSAFLLSPAGSHPMPRYSLSLYCGHSWPRVATEQRKATSTAATQTENCPKTAGDTRKCLAVRDQRTVATKIRLPFASSQDFCEKANKCMFGVFLSKNMKWWLGWSKLPRICLGGRKRRAAMIAFTEYMPKSLQTVFQIVFPSVNLWVYVFSPVCFPLIIGAVAINSRAEQAEETVSTRAARPRGLQATIIHLAELPSSVDIKLPEQ